MPNATPIASHDGDLHGWLEWHPRTSHPCGTPGVQVLACLSAVPSSLLGLPDGSSKRRGRRGKNELITTLLAGDAREGPLHADSSMAVVMSLCHATAIEPSHLEPRG